MRTNLTNNEIDHITKVLDLQRNTIGNFNEETFINKHFNITAETYYKYANNLELGETYIYSDDNGTTLLECIIVEIEENSIIAEFWDEENQESYTIDSCHKEHFHK